MKIILNRIKQIATNKGTMPLNDDIMSKLIIQGFNPQEINNIKPCKCGKELREVCTESKYYGRICCTATECDNCKDLAYEEFKMSEVKKLHGMAQVKCGCYQNKPAKHWGIYPMLNDIKKDFHWQERFISYAMNVCGDQNKKGYFLTGSPGVGKTFLVKILHNELLALFKNSTFIKAVELSILLRQIAFAKNYKDIVDEFKKVDTLIIDDWGTQKNTEFVSETMFSIFDYRYENNKRTIITSNLDAEEIEKFDNRLFSRFMDKDWIIYQHLVATDLRQSNF